MFGTKPSLIALRWFYTPTIPPSPLHQPIKAMVNSACECRSLFSVRRPLRVAGEWCVEEGMAAGARRRLLPGRRADAVSALCCFPRTPRRRGVGSVERCAVATAAVPKGGTVTAVTALLCWLSVQLCACFCCCFCCCVWVTSVSRRLAVLLGYPHPHPHSPLHPLPAPCCGQ